MIKYLVIGTLGLSLSLAGHAARAHDEAAYFVLGTVVGSALTRHSAYHAPVGYTAPVVYVPAYRHAHHGRPTVVVHQRYYAPAPRYRHRVETRHGHPHGGPPGQRRHSRGR